MFCANCGIKLDSNSKFCQNCGEMLQHSSHMPSHTSSSTIPHVQHPKSKGKGKVIAIICLLAAVVIIPVLIFSGVFASGEGDDYLADMEDVSRDDMLTYENAEPEPPQAASPTAPTSPPLAPTAGASIHDFTVTPIFPPNQDPDAHGFFDVWVIAGTHQRLDLEVDNTTSGTITVEISINTVVTSRIGIIDYSSSGEPDESMLHPFAEIASLGTDSEIAIPPNSGVKVSIYIDIPQEGFDGIILGSIGVLLGMTDEQREDAGMFVQRYQRAVAVRLQESESSIAPDFVLGDVGAELVNFRSTIVANVRNPLPRIVLETTISAQIYSVDDNDPWLTTLRHWNVDFAPNSFFPLAIDIPTGSRLYPGDYVARVQIEYDGTTWNLEREFVISEELANEINMAADELFDE